MHQANYEGELPFHKNNYMSVNVWLLHGKDKLENKQEQDI